jgi:hypothetical protein
MELKLVKFPAKASSAMSSVVVVDRVGSKKQKQYLRMLTDTKRKIQYA